MSGFLRTGPYTYTYRGCVIERHPCYGNGHFSVWSVDGKGQFPTRRDAARTIDRRLAERAAMPLARPAPQR